MFCYQSDPHPLDLLCFVPNLTHIHRICCVLLPIWPASTGFVVFCYQSDPHPPDLLCFVTNLTYIHRICCVLLPIWPTSTRFHRICVLLPIWPTSTGFVVFCSQSNLHPSDLCFVTNLTHIHRICCVLLPIWPTSTGFVVFCYQSDLHPSDLLYVIGPGTIIQFTRKYGQICHADSLRTDNIITTLHNTALKRSAYHIECPVCTIDMITTRDWIRPGHASFDVQSSNSVQLIFQFYSTLESHICTGIISMFIAAWMRHPPRTGYQRPPWGLWALYFIIVTSHGRHAWRLKHQQIDCLLIKFSS